MTESTQEAVQLDEKNRALAILVNAWVLELPDGPEFYSGASSDATLAAANREAFREEADKTRINPSELSPAGLRNLLDEIHEDLVASGKVKLPASANSDSKQAVNRQPRDAKGQFTRAEADKLSEFAQFYAAASTRGIRERARKDPEFAAYLNKRVRQETTLAAPEAPPAPAKPERPAVELTAEQYRSMPSRVVAAKMQDPLFVAAVERLIGEGQI